MKIISDVAQFVFKARQNLGAAFIATILSGVMAGTALGETAETPTVRLLDSPREISVTGLIDQNGRPFDFEELRGKVVMVMFGFTNCVDVCPMTLQRLKNLENFAATHFDNIAYVMVSVDGQRDTSEAMRRYLAPFSSRFIGLSGDSGAIRKAAFQFSASYFKGVSSTGDNNYEVSHSPQVFVVDPAGQVRAELFNASVETMYSVSHALADETGEMSVASMEQ